jgi:hypothetical protein
MSKEKVFYQLNDRHQLIDLNQKLVNFKLEFKVESEPVGQEFHTIVMNQDQIDEYEKLDQIEMKLAPGKIGGTIVADNNKYQNYFLILRSSKGKPVGVNVYTSIQEIEPKITVEPSPQPSIHETQETSEAQASDTLEQIPMYKKPWFWLVIIVAIAVLGYLCYDYIRNRRLNNQPIVSTIKEATTSNPPVVAEAPSSTPSVEDQMYSKVGTIA